MAFPLAYLLLAAGGATAGVVAYRASTMKAPPPEAPPEPPGPTKVVFRDTTAKEVHQQALAEGKKAEPIRQFVLTNSGALFRVGSVTAAELREAKRQAALARYEARKSEAEARASRAKARGERADLRRMKVESEQLDVDERLDDEDEIGAVGVGVSLANDAQGRHR